MPSYTKKLPEIFIPVEMQNYRIKGALNTI